MGPFSLAGLSCSLMQPADKGFLGCYQHPMPLILGAIKTGAGGCGNETGLTGRLLHSPSLVAVHLSVGRRHRLQLADITG